MKTTSMKDILEMPFFKNSANLWLIVSYKRGLPDEGAK